ncbi:hypothetical protein A3Q56_03822 [Intoshia linei]|uniref:DNA topoisomerase 2 n=1 Tax=Intoshia linei TaxID=1819745 RepID=A0A177B2T6_9BILA|nr:hypothetical protein A3Q56_03822 [Intoshia linei]
MKYSSQSKSVTKKHNEGTIEKIYQKKTQLEHILLRPDTYIGSIEKITQLMWVFDEEKNHMIKKEISFVPGLYKIFDEIIVNAADNKVRDSNMDCIKIKISREENMISIWNNGKSVPIVMHKVEKMYVPSLIFGQLLTSSNYDDTKKKVTGGRNGYGAKLCNAFSVKFTLETQSRSGRKKFKQTWKDNMSTEGEPKIVPIERAAGDDYTRVSFSPDLKRFGMETLEDDIIMLFKRRAYDICAVSKCKVFLNGEKIPIKNFKDFVDLHIRGMKDELGQPLNIAYDKQERWEIALTVSDTGFQHSSFVNSIATTKGGRHVDYIADQIVSKILEAVKKKQKKGSVEIKPFQVKNHLFLFLNVQIENPQFDSQTKENFTSAVRSFGSKCVISDKFVTQVIKLGIVDSILNWAALKSQDILNKKSGVKTCRLRGIPKLEDANNAGTKNSINCTLILTEGDSAKTLAVSGLSVVGRNLYGVFPLRGKVLNVREASHKQIMENAEINNIIKIMGLKYKDKYVDRDSLKSLRYGKILIMTDQDQDGSHIKGLLINFIHYNWPNLLQHKFLDEFITPIVKVSKRGNSQSFYSMPEFEIWKNETENWQTFNIKYYKGLGTSTSKEAKEYFQDLDRHLINFKYDGNEDDKSIELAFSKKKIEQRKVWLTNWMEKRRERILHDLPEEYLYKPNLHKISYTDFVNKELVLFSNMDNERSIPSLVDGFKPGQRKVMYTCFKRNLIKELKVAQLSGSVAELSAYHHGEVSLMATIINLAHDFVGSNNINLLMPNGQFGTRLAGGKDAASPRYIFTCLNAITRKIFRPEDDSILSYTYDDTFKTEPKYYVPILPMILVNGCEGIGTGWSTKIPNYNPIDIVNNLKRLLKDEEMKPMMPYYRGYRGEILEFDSSKYITCGELAVLDNNSIEISELPIKVWTQTYKENVIESLMYSNDNKNGLVTDYSEYHTDTTVRFVLKVKSELFNKHHDSAMYKYLKLQSSISTNSMVLFDSNGCIKRFSNVSEMMKEFYIVRLKYYLIRKKYMVGLLTAEAKKYSNQARFIIEYSSKKIVIDNVPRKKIIEILIDGKYDSDPIKKWNEKQKIENVDQSNEEEQDSNETHDFNYILNMSLWTLSKEKREELLKQKGDKLLELSNLEKLSAKDLWLSDLEEFLVAYRAFLDEKESELKSALNPKMKKKGTSLYTKKDNNLVPSKYADRIAPKIDQASLDLKKKVELKAKIKLEKDKQVKVDNVKSGKIIDVKLEKVDNVDETEFKSLYERIGVDPVTKKRNNNDIKATKMKKIKLDSKKEKIVDDSCSDNDLKKNKKKDITLDSSDSELESISQLSKTKKRKNDDIKPTKTKKFKLDSKKEKIFDHSCSHNDLKKNEKKNLTLNSSDSELESISQLSKTKKLYLFGNSNNKSTNKKGPLDSSDSDQDIIDVSQSPIKKKRNAKDKSTKKNIASDNSDSSIEEVKLVRAKRETKPIKYNLKSEDSESNSEESESNSDFVSDLSQSSFE